MFLKRKTYVNFKIFCDIKFIKLSIVKLAIEHLPNRNFKLIFFKIFVDELSPLRICCVI